MGHSSRKLVCYRLAASKMLYSCFLQHRHTDPARFASALFQEGLIPSHDDFLVSMHKMQVVKTFYMVLQKQLVSIIVQSIFGPGHCWAGAPPTQQIETKWLQID